MNAEAVFNRYDIRGDYPEEIDEEFAERLGRAVGTYAVRNGRGTVVVGRDTRDASAAVHPAFIDGVRATGADVVDTGTGPTDRTALAAAHYGGIGAMVTASHHAWERTGFKLLYEAGNGFSKEDMETVKDLFRDGQFETGEGTLLRVQQEFDEIYLEDLVDAFTAVTGDEALDARVLIDGSGSAGRLAAAVFKELGAEVVEHERAKRPDPEPRPETRGDVTAAAADADIGVGYDPDGDRVYAVHPELGWMSGDELFYALAATVEPETIVASIDTAPFIEEAGGDVTYTRVGDIFVSAEGREVDADLLGEPNGHYAVPAFCWYNSGILASLLLAAVAGDLPDILAPVEGYRTARTTAVFDTMEERDAALQDIKKRVARNYDVVSRLDGVKFRGDGVTGLVRPSGTSPKLRVVVHTHRDGTDPQEVADDLV